MLNRLSETIMFQRTMQNRIQMKMEMSLKTMKKQWVIINVPNKKHVVLD